MQYAAACRRVGQRVRGRKAEPVVSFIIAGLPLYADSEAWQALIEKLPRPSDPGEDPVSLIVRSYHRAALQWILKCAGPGSRLVRAVTHNDEAAPHMHDVERKKYFAQQVVDLRRRRRPPLHPSGRGRQSRMAIKVWGETYQRERTEGLDAAARTRNRHAARAKLAAAAANRHEQVPAPDLLPLRKGGYASAAPQAIRPTVPKKGGQGSEKRTTGRGAR